MKNASLRGAPPHEPPPRRLSVTSIPPSALCPSRSAWFFTLSFVGHLDCFSCLCPLFPEQLVVLGLSWPMFDDRQQKLFEIGFKCWQIASLAWWRYTLSISHWDVSLLCVVSSAASSQVGKKQWQAAGGSRHASQTLIHIIVTIINIVIFNICPSSCYSDRTPLHHHHHRHQKHQQQPLNDDTKNLTETDTETFFTIPNFPKPKPILFSDTKFFETETEIIKNLAKVSRPSPKLRLFIFKL